MKDILKSVPILKIACPDEYFVVCIDACKEVLDRFLSQKDHVVCYESRKLKNHERNYAMHELELATIVHALEMWRNYLMVKKFELRTCHYGQKHLFLQPTLNSIQTRWLEFLSEYDFEIKHIKGKDNQVVDALNMRVHEVHIVTISMYMTYLKEKMIATTNSDHHHVKIKRSIAKR